MNESLTLQNVGRFQQVVSDIKVSKRLKLDRTSLAGRPTAGFGANQEDRENIDPNQENNATEANVRKSLQKLSIGNTKTSSKKRVFCEVSNHDSKVEKSFH